MSQYLRYDARLYGAKQIALITASPVSLAVSCGSSKRVLLLTPTLSTTVTVDSGVLTGEPNGILYLAPYVWTITNNGRLIQLNATTLATVTDQYVGASSSNWIATSNGFILCSGPTGGVVCYNSSGVFVDRIDGVLDGIDTAAANGSYLYCIGSGVGAVVSISAAGKLAKVNEFVARNCKGNVRAKIANSALVVAGTERGTVAVFNIATDPTAPTQTSRSTSTGILTSVAGDTANTPVGNLKTIALDWWFPATDATYAVGGTTPGYFVLHGSTGQITLSAPKPAYLLAAIAGNGGKMGYSRDGITWVETGSIAGSFDGFSVAGVDTTYILLSGWIGTTTTMYKSANDGVSWSAVTPGFTAGVLIGTRGMIKFNSLYILGGQAPTGGTPHIYRTSPDLVTWSDPTTVNAGYGTTGFTSGYVGIASIASDGVTLACGGTSTPTTPCITWSTDGITFTASTLPPLGNANVYDLAYSPALNKWVAVGSTTSDGHWVSSDGRTWTTNAVAPLGSGVVTRSVSWSPTLNLFVAVGNGGKVASSTNGTAWTLRVGAHGVDTIQSVSWIATLGLFIAAGSNGAKLSSSPDGINWTIRTPAWSGGATSAAIVSLSLTP